jgi:DNA-binding MarR family transcriptional regulator
MAPGETAVHHGCMAMLAQEQAPFDRVLEVLERRGLSPGDLRVLLGLLGRDASLAELAEALGKPPGEVFRAGGRLATRGLVRWYHFGPHKETRLVLTGDGLATMRALLAEAERALGERKPAAHRSARGALAGGER